MSEFSEEIKGVLDEIMESAKDGSTELIRYVAERRQVIAEAVAAGSSDLNDIVKQEVLNMKAFAATEAVKQADKVDGIALQFLLKAFSAFDTMLIASLA